MRLQPFGLAYAALLIWLAIQLVSLSRAGRSLAASRSFRFAAVLGGVALVLGPIGLVALPIFARDSERLMDAAALLSLTAAASAIRQAVAGVRAT